MNIFEEQFDIVDINDEAAVKVCCRGRETIWMPLNNQCVKELRKFLDGKAPFRPKQLIFVRDNDGDDWQPVRFSGNSGKSIIDVDGNGWRYAKAITKEDIEWPS